MGIYPVYYSDRESRKKRPVRGFWLLLLLFLVRRGGGVVGGCGGDLVPVPKIGPPKTECPPPPPPPPLLPTIISSWPFTSSPPSYVSVCVPVLLSAACCLAGAPATHTETVRRLSRHKNLQGCSLFPQPSLSTIQINIFGGAEKSEKKSGRPPGCVRHRCKRRGLSVLPLVSKKLIYGRWRGYCAVPSAGVVSLPSWSAVRLRRQGGRSGREIKWRKCGCERKLSTLSYTGFKKSAFKGKVAKLKP